MKAVSAFNYGDVHALNDNGYYRSASNFEDLIGIYLSKSPGILRVNTETGFVEAFLDRERNVLY